VNLARSPYTVNIQKLIILGIIKKSKYFFPCFLAGTCPKSYVSLYPGNHKKFYFRAAWGPGLGRRRLIWGADFNIWKTIFCIYCPTFLPFFLRVNTLVWGWIRVGV